MRELPSPHSPHAGVLAVSQLLRQRIAEATPFALIRLGDGEGRLLGYPEFVDKAELDHSLQIWFGRTNFAPAALADLAVQLRQATLAADVLGLPRAAQLELPEYRALLVPLARFGLLAHGPVLTDSAIIATCKSGCSIVNCLPVTLLRAGDLPRSGRSCCQGIRDRPDRVFWYQVRLSIRGRGKVNIIQRAFWSCRRRSQFLFAGQCS